MKKKTLHLILKYGALTLIFILFCYFRLKPLYFQTVGYTYDQGRDFLKAAEIVLYKNPTFIGPTTGIVGIYHGAWWYYLLTLPFALFKGSPIGFYYFNFFIQLLSFSALLVFLKKRIDALSLTIILGLIATSGYFIFTSIFLGNNIMVLPALLAFLIFSQFIYEKNEKIGKKILFAIGLALGFVSEFEFAFGLFIIPSFFIISLLIKKIRKKIYTPKNFIIFFFGLTIPFLPRILFELKHGFSQTKVLISFFLKPKLYNPKPLKDIFIDRSNTFVGYYKSLFFNEILFYAATLLILVCLIIIIYKKRKLLTDSILKYYISLLLLLYLFSNTYKDNFWGNYYEGIQYLFLFIIGIIIYSTSSLKKPVEKILIIFKIILISLILFFGLSSVIKDFKIRPKISNLALQEKVIETLQTNESNLSNYCLKVYTPPVIPYTYDYLLLYKKISKDIEIPKDDWINNRCWIILEKDDFKERRDKWIKDNIPTGSKVIKKHEFGDTNLFLYEKSIK